MTTNNMWLTRKVLISLAIVLFALVSGVLGYVINDVDEVKDDIVTLQIQQTVDTLMIGYMVDELKEINQSLKEIQKELSEK